MAQLIRQRITEAILTPAFDNSDTGAGDKIKNNDGKTFLFLKNPGASQATITVAVQGASRDVPGYGPMTKASLVIVLEAGEEKMAGPFPSSAWSDSSGDLNLSYSGAGAADVDVAALTI